MERVKSSESESNIKRRRGRGGERRKRRRRWKRNRDVTWSFQELVKSQNIKDIKRKVSQKIVMYIDLLFRNENQVSPSFLDIHVLATDGHGRR